MPTYEYVCLECGKEFDYVQSMRDEPLQRCVFDACDGPVRRRIGSGAGLIFKGSGFYITDYKKNGGGNGDAAPAKTETKAPSPDAGCTSNPATCASPACAAKSDD